MAAHPGEGDEQAKTGRVEVMEEVAVVEEVEEVECSYSMPLKLQNISRIPYNQFREIISGKT